MLRILTCLLLALSVLYAEQETVWVTDDPANPKATRYEVVGDDVGKLYGDHDLAVKSTGWPWDRRLQLVVDGQGLSKQQMDDSDIIIYTHNSYGAKSKPAPARRFEENELRAAIIMLFPEDGEALLQFLDNNTPDANADVGSFRFLGFQFVDGSGSAKLIRESAGRTIRIYNKAGRTPFDGARDFYCLMHDIMEDSESTRFRIELAVFLSDLSLNQQGGDGVGPYEDYHRNFKKRLNAGILKIATYARIYVTLPAFFNPAANFLISLSDVTDALQDGNTVGALVSALGFLEFAHFPKGVNPKVRVGDKVWEFSPEVRKGLSDAVEETGGIKARETKLAEKMETVVEAARKAGKIEEATALCRYLYCYAAGTPVWTSRGLVPIEQVHPDDQVLSWTESTETVDFHRVYGTTDKIAPEVVTISLHSQSTDAETTITCTPEHPFLIDDGLCHRWCSAGALTVGSTVRSLDGSATVVRTATHHEATEVFNIGVEWSHTYFVGDGAILTHNAACPCAVKLVEEYRKNGKTIFHLLDDLAPEALQAMITTEKGTLDLETGRYLAGLVRTSVDHMHEWLPVNQLYKTIIPKVTDKVLQSKLFHFMDDARIGIDELWFTAKGEPPGFLNNRPIGHQSGKVASGPYKGVQFANQFAGTFAKQCDAAFETALSADGKKFSIDTWYANVTQIVNDYFAAGVNREGILANVKAIYDRQKANFP